MPLSEDQALKILSEILPETYRRARRIVRLGIGDDTAVLSPGGGEQLWTIDTCEEGTHFLWNWMKPADVAHKALQSALSDVAAMGGAVRGVLCHITLSPRVSRRWLSEFAQAQAEVCRSARIPLVGGNLSFGDSVSVATTVLGEAPIGESLLRAGAQPGDELWLIGDVGLARAGLLLLQEGKRRRRPCVDTCLTAFRRPVAQLERGKKLLGRATSCMDVSDGLAGDVGELARSSGVRLIVNGELLSSNLRDELIETAQLLRVDARETALIGGEDYALLATGPSAKRPRFAQVIGRVEVGEGAALELDGACRSLNGGFIHGQN